MDSISGELICGVCLEFFEDPLLLPCAHNFCKKCIYGVIENYAPFVGLVPMGHSSSYKCPVCQKSFSSKSCSVDKLPRNKALENIINMYISASPVDIFDTGWNSDLDVSIVQCPKHQLPMESFCRSCNLSACEKCEREHHQSKDSKHRHKVLPIKDAAYKQQAEIADALTEIKKRSINLNERLQLLKDMEEHIENNEKSLLAELDHHVNTIMSAVRKQHEELKRRLRNDFTDVKKPVEDELRRCNSLKTSMHELMKKVSDIKRTVDSGLRISLMTGAKKQLNSLLCFDIAWSVKDHSLPTSDLPMWRLDVQEVLDCVGSLDWVKEGSKMRTVASQTEVEVALKNNTTTESSIIHLQADRDSMLKTAGLTDSAATYRDSHEKIETDKFAQGPTSADKVVKAKYETTFGVDNVVVFGDKTDVTPKIKSDIRSSSALKLPQDVETDGGLASDTDVSDDGSAKTLLTEILEHRLTKPDSTQKTNKNLSPSSSVYGAEFLPKETIELIRSQTSALPNLNPEHQINVTDGEHHKVSVVTSATDKRADVTVQNNKEPAIHSTNRVSERGVPVDEEFAKTGAKPKVIVSHVKNSNDQLQNKISPWSKELMKDKAPKQESYQKNSESVEPQLMEISFDDDNNDDQFLTQSLNRISFQPKLAAKEDHRNSFPPDTLPNSNLIPRSQPFHKFEKPKGKQRSPHQDAVAKFVARRRTGSPRIPKTVSSQNLQTSVEFPKTLSSPALSQLSVANKTSGELRGEHSIDHLSKNDRGTDLIGQGHLYSEKSDDDVQIKSAGDTQNELNEDNVSEGAQKLSPHSASSRKILKGRRSAVN